MPKRILTLFCAVATAAVMCGCGRDTASEPVLKSELPAEGNIRDNPVLKPEDEWDYETDDDGCIALERYKGKDTAVKIPSELDDKPIKRIGYLFRLPDGTASVEFPASIEEIDQAIHADTVTEFIVAEDNKNYYSKDGIIYIKSDKMILYDKDELFSCPRGKSGEVVVPEGTTAISSYAFSACEKITSVKLPESVTKIENGAFSHCTALTSINIPKAVTEIDAYTFDGCSSLETLDIPETVTKISQYPFNETPFQNKIAEKETFVVINGILVDATAAKGDVTVPDTVKKISYRAFAPKRDENTWLTKVTIPDSVTEMDGSVFENCTALEEVRLPSGIIEIGWSLFENCKSLKSVDIPNGVTEIGLDAFENCENLTQVNVPDSVSGAFGCFEGCGKVNVTFKGKTYAAANIDEFYKDVYNVQTGQVNL